MLAHWGVRNAFSSFLLDPRPSDALNLSKKLSSVTARNLAWGTLLQVSIDLPELSPSRPCGEGDFPGEDSLRAA